MSSIRNVSGENLKTGLLILNLGTPDAPEPEAVGRYLHQFLMDEWVIDIPAPLRWFFVNVMIVPKRKFASAEAYKTIWTERGSPLLIHLEDLEKKVSQLVPEWKVASAMRYGNPTTQSGLERLKDCDRILVFPLYPQYAESSTRSSKEEVTRAAKKLGLKAQLLFLKDFYEHPEFIESFAETALKSIAPGTGTASASNQSAPQANASATHASATPSFQGQFDHVLMSFHGLPERQIKRTDLSGGQHCLASTDCCAKITDVNRNCYRAQSYATARALAKRLGLNDDQYSVSFQSRLGRTPWIKPYTDEVIPELAKRGVKRLAVMCPSFAADCLETIEEIGDRARHLFLENGGESFAAVPCPNSSDRWASGVVSISRELVK